MAQITIEVPDEVVRTLEALARNEKKTVAEVAAECLAAVDSPKGSPEAVLRALRRSPPLSGEAWEAFQAAIASGRTPPNNRGIFDE